MQTLCWLLWLTGAYPLGQAWWANRRTTLFHTLCWAFLSWVAWGLALGTANRWPAPAQTAAGYLALCVTGCAGIAVLGARWPGVRAWNFVVVALLAVELLPVAEGIATGTRLQLSSVRIVYVAAALCVGFLNYLPTRFCPAALTLLLGCGINLAVLLVPVQSDLPAQQYLALGNVVVAAVPWLAYGSLVGGKPPLSEFDRLWHDFRNRYGFVWGQRLRDQFNRSAAHAGWPVVLRWQGLRLKGGEDLPQPGTHDAILATLQALMKRFTHEEENSSGSRKER